MTTIGAFLRQPADNLRAADHIDAVDIPLAAEQRSGYILQIGIAAGGAAHDGAQIAAVERRSGDQFAQDVSEEADSHRQELGQQGVLTQTASIRVLGLELAHAMRRPQLPCFKIVGRHAPFLEFRSQFVKEVRVYADSGGDGEVARGGLAVEILVLNSAERDAPDFSIDCDLSRSARAEGDCQVVRESVGGAERENGQRNWRASQSLNNIVDRAIAPAGKDGITAGRDSHAGVVGRFRTGAANRKFGADAGRLDDANGMVQFLVALSSSAARIGIEQNGGFAHALASSLLSLAHAPVIRVSKCDEVNRRLLPGPNLHYACAKSLWCVRLIQN